MGINDFPTEIILHILNMITSSLTLPTSRSRQLMAVCRRWHDIITSAPEFWTDVWVFADEPRPAHLDWLILRLAAQLARCKSALIDVRWQVRLSEPQTRQLMETFAKYASFDRWRSLHVVYHVGNVPDIATSLSPLGVFLNSTLPPSAPLREFQYYPLDILLSNDPEALSNILHTISKLHASRILIMSSSTGESSDLPANITDITLSQFRYTAGLGFSHVKRMAIQSPVSAGELALHAFPALTTLDVTFDNGISVRRLAFPVLLELRLRGENYHTLSDIDAPRLQVLIIDGGPAWRHRRARKSLEDAVKQREYALQPTRELEIGVMASTQTLQALLDRSSALEKLTVHMTGDARDRELLRLLLFPSASPEDNGDEDGDESEDESEGEWETRRQDILPSDEGDIVEKPRGQNLCSLTIHIESVWELVTWEKCLRGFEDVVKGRKGRESNTRFKCLPMRRRVY